MHRIRVIPVLLLDRNGLYKTVKFSNPKYVGDPINAVRIFNDKEVDELVLLDFRASKENRKIDIKTIQEIAGEAFMPLAYGGGIRCFDDAKSIFRIGFEKVVLNSYLFESFGMAREIADVYGSQAVIASIDVKKDLLGRYKVYGYSGTKNMGETPIEWARKLVRGGVGEIIVNSINRDGTWSGYDQELIGAISGAVNVPVIALGGASSVEDFKTAVISGASAVAAGSLFVYQSKGKGVLINMPVTYL